MTGAAEQKDGVAALEAQADRAAAAGDVATARRLLEQVTAAEPGRGEPWLKLTAMCRAQGDLPAALDAVSGALRLEPLAFLPLLLKASLLEQAGQAEAAGETYGYALAQQPEPETLPPQLRAMAERGRRIHDAHVARKADRLKAAEEGSGAALEPREQARMARFRSNILRRTRPYH